MHTRWEVHVDIEAVEEREGPAVRKRAAVGREDVTLPVPWAREDMTHTHTRVGRAVHTLIAPFPLET